MNKSDQIAFVRELSDNILREVVKKIVSDKIPEEWDGHELRCLLAYKFDQSADMTTLRRNRRGKRNREFQNTIIVNNL